MMKRAIFSIIISLLFPLFLLAGTITECVAQVEIRGGSGSGTCLVWEGKDIILSAAHVVANSPTATVTFPNGKTATCKVLATSQTLDLAVLELPAGAEPANKTRIAANPIENGAAVWVVGYPFGRGPNTRSGRLLSQHTGQRGFQHSITVKPGDSGGGVFNEGGELVSVVLGCIAADPYERGNGPPLAAIRDFVGAKVRVIPTNPMQPLPRGTIGVEESRDQCPGGSCWPPSRPSQPYAPISPAPPSPSLPPSTPSNGDSARIISILEGMNRRIDGLGIEQIRRDVDELRSRPQIPGPQGVAGPAGPQGPKGDPGTPGTPGRDAVDQAEVIIIQKEIALLKAQLAEVVVKQGERGPQGIAGKDGAMGPAGPAGKCDPKEIEALKKEIETLKQALQGGSVKIQVRPDQTNPNPK